MTGTVTRGDLVARLRLAADRLRELRRDVESSDDNVIRFRVERHLEAAEETLRDLDVPANDLPSAGSYERGLFERGVSRAESEVAFAEAKVDAAWAEERHDPRGFVRASDRAMAAQLSARVPPGSSLGQHEHVF
jgi:hypothetical protein